MARDPSPASSAECSVDGVVVVRSWDASNPSSHTRNPRAASLRILRRCPSLQTLRVAVSELHSGVPELLMEPCLVWDSEMWDACADPGAKLSADEVVAIRLCNRARPKLLEHMNQALRTWEATQDVEGKAWPWNTVAGNLISGLEKLRSCQHAQPETVRCLVWLGQHTWEEHIAKRVGGDVCFVGALGVTLEEEEVLLQSVDDAVPEEGKVPCLLEFTGAAARAATDVGALAVSTSIHRWLLPPFTHGSVASVSTESSPGQKRQVFRARIEGVRTVESLPAVLQAPAGSVLAGSLLVGLHQGSTHTDTSLLPGVVAIFQRLVDAVNVKSPAEVENLWKSYLSCMFEECHSWKEYEDSIHSSVVGTAKVAARDLTVASLNVTKRALGFQSCMDTPAMERERARRVSEVEEAKKEAVSVARSQVLALQLETVTEMQGFINFLQYDPVKAFEALMPATQAYLEAGPAQRVLIFAKLMALVALAGGLLEGEPKVQSAFELPLPPGSEEGVPKFNNLPAAALEKVMPLMPQLNKNNITIPVEDVRELLRLQRLRLSRTRLLVVGGAPDVGKSTLLKEVYGLHHLRAGLSPECRTDEMTFELHPEGDEQLRAVYLVDTPGLGDGECVYRNDMGRLLMWAQGWIPSGITLVWVVRAGRNVRSDASEFLQRTVSAHADAVVLVTHIDKFFEDRYREVGPQWRDGPLRGVPASDPRWAEQRRLFMTELHDEIMEGVRVAAGCDSLDLEVVYTCLGGYMASETEEEDEFSEKPPWHWAQRELSAFFGVRGKRELRRWLDDRLGI